MSTCARFFPEESIDEKSSDALLIVASSAALLTLLPIAAHQLGGLDHLPDPPSSLFDSDRITDSRSAHPLGIPDSLLGLGSYAVTLALAVFVHKDRRIKTLLALKLVADGSVAAFNVGKQVVSFRKLCSWCTATALCTGVMVFAGRGLISEQASELRHIIQS